MILSDRVQDKMSCFDTWVPDIQHFLSDNVWCPTDILIPEMKKFIALLTKEKGKTAINELENDDWHFSRFIQCIYKKIRQFFFYNCQLVYTKILQFC